MALEASSWKYDSVYKMLLNDPNFNPIILVCPQVNRGHEFMLEKLRQCNDFFYQKGYNYICSFNEKTSEYIDANTLSPDIIFYTNPYKGLIDDRYYIDQFPAALTCYVNYAYNNHIHEFGFNLPFHRQVWRYFIECVDNKKLVESLSPINGVNCVVSGYPMFDAYTCGTNEGINWKLKDRKHKRIIWSPHHTISIQTELLRYSTFELYYDVIWNLSQKYKNEVQFVFKPHPLLKEALYRLDGWGKGRTDAYYEMWSKGENTAIAEGEYVDLFNSSDAMINDSGSFTIEYLYTCKPCLLLNNYNRQADANIVSLKAIDCWYQATDATQIENFIKEVLLQGVDPLKSKREAFYNEVLLPPNGCTVAENIVNEIKKELRLK